MKVLQKLYRKYYNFITKGLFPILLLVYPLVKINQGIDVSDSTYSLGNYLFFEQMEGAWVISTYLSNVAGWILTRLPLGTTLLGMNLYTCLGIGILTVVLYFLMSRWMPDWIVFIGEMIAINFLWIPTGILYNYLTYAFFALGAICLYKGLVEEKNDMLILAGVLLGMNVWVRIPNLAEMALIVCVWFYCYEQREHIRNKQEMLFKVMAQKTAFCILGYGIGIAVPSVMILLQYGLEGVTDTIRWLSSIQGTDDSYSLFSMFMATIKAYVRSFKWYSFVIAGVAMGLAIFVVKKDKYVQGKKILYLLGIGILLRFFWGRGMFSFRYYEDYSSMYEWGMIGLGLALIAIAYLFVAKGVSKDEKLWGMICLVVLFVTPLGSNNYTYQNLNNLFLVAPITLYAFVKWFRRKYAPEKRVFLFPPKAMLVVLGSMILLQSTGFHFNFVFRDGMDGTPRNTVVTGFPVVAQMRTTQKNAEELSGLLSHMQQDVSETAVYFGNCPGLSFILQKPSAIDSTWPDLDSNSVEWFEDSLAKLDENPIVIVRKIEATSDLFMEKEEVLRDFMNTKHYEVGYENNGYIVYQSQEK